MKEIALQKIKKPSPRFSELLEVDKDAALNDLKGKESLSFDEVVFTRITRFLSSYLVRVWSYNLLVVTIFVRLTWL